MGVKARPLALPGEAITVDEQRRFSVDGLLPSTVIRPKDADEAARELYSCGEVPAAVGVWGGGTQMQLGAPPRKYEVALSTERMTRLLEYEPADLTCRVEAGMRLSDLQAALHAQGQRLALGPPQPAPALGVGLKLAHQYLAPATAIVQDGDGGQWVLALRLEGYTREVQAAKDQAVRFVREAGGAVDAPETPPAFWDAARDWSTPADGDVVLRAIVPLTASPLLLAAVPAAARVLAQPASGGIAVRVAAPSAAETLSRLRTEAGA